MGGNSAAYQKEERSDVEILKWLGFGLILIVSYIVLGRFFWTLWKVGWNVDRPSRWWGIIWPVTLVVVILCISFYLITKIFELLTYIIKKIVKFTVYLFSKILFPVAEWFGTKLGSFLRDLG